MPRLITTYRDQIESDARAMRERGLAASYPIAERILALAPLCEVDDDAQELIDDIRTRMAQRLGVAEPISRLPYRCPELALRAGLIRREGAA